MPLSFASAQGVDLSVTKTAGSLENGKLLRYTIVYENRGSQVAKGTVLRDSYSSGGLQTMATPPEECDDDGNQLLCFIGDLIPYGGGTFTYTVNVSPDAPDLIITPVNISSAETDTDPSNNTVVTPVTIPVPAATATSTPTSTPIVTPAPPPIEASGGDDNYEGADEVGAEQEDDDLGSEDAFTDGTAGPSPITEVDLQAEEVSTESDNRDSEANEPVSITSEPLTDDFIESERAAEILPSREAVDVSELIANSEPGSEQKAYKGDKIYGKTGPSASILLIAISLIGTLLVATVRRTK